MDRSKCRLLIGAGFLGMVLVMIPVLALAKGAPPLPGGAVFKTVGPSSNGSMTFFIENGEQKVTFVGHCGNDKVEGTVPFEWAKAGSPALAATDLVQHGKDCTGDDCPFEALFEVPDGPLADAARACYGIPANEPVILQFKNVKNFKEVLPNQVYTAEVAMGRVIPQ